MSTPLDDPLATSVPSAPDTASEQSDDWDEEFPSARSSRRTRSIRLLLIGGIVAGVAFTAGVTVEKRTGDASTNAFPPGLGAGGALPAGLSSLLGGGAGAGAAPASSAAVVGTVIAVDADVITVEDLGGNRYQIQTSPTTTITATRPLTSDELVPGQSVSVTGTKHTDSTVDATAITAR